MDRLSLAGAPCKLMPVAVDWVSQAGCLFGVQISFASRIGYGLLRQVQSMRSCENVGNRPRRRSNRHPLLLRNVVGSKISAVDYNPRWFLAAKAGALGNCKVHLCRVSVRKSENQK